MGHIDRLFTGYGFIKARDGREFYFDESCLIQPEFEELEIGTQVHFIEVEAGDTLRASQISANGKMMPEDSLE